MTPIILHCFYDGNEIRGYAQSRPQGLINIRDKVPLSFVLCGGCYERLTAGITKVIVIFLVFHSTKKGLSLVDSWSTEPYKVLRWPLVIWFPDLPRQIRQSGHEKLGLVTQHERLVLLWKHKYRYFT